MSGALLRKCNWPGCRKLIDQRQSYCSQHERQNKRQYDKPRPTAAQRGYNAKWRRARAAYLREHPVCECPDCKRMGRLRPATVVDHIIPHKGDDKLFWDETNWQAMAKRCHDRKTAREDGGFGNARNRV